MKCECGCGSDTANAVKTNKRWGTIQGQPQRFVHGHNNRRDPIIRFWNQVIKGDDCWEWSGAKATAGYGEMTIEKSPVAAHRISWELANGPIPLGMFVCHKCDNRGCVNPDHLFLGSQSDNMRDCSRKGRIRNQYSMQATA